VKAGAGAKPAANWIMSELQALLIASQQEIGACKIGPAQLAGLIGLIDSGAISGKMGKDVIAEMFRSGKDAKAIVDARGLTQISDESAIETAIREVLAQHPGPVAEFRSGKAKAKGFLVGQVMRAMQGKGNPQVVNRILDELLAKG
jgi:aspartyl-tRNA(Asn)/glutamyl-tRNA(Gln) amidotransferase subunit B